MATRRILMKIWMTKWRRDTHYFVAIGRDQFIRPVYHLQDDQITEVSRQWYPEGFPMWDHLTWRSGR